jgi:hypothetical protein
LSTASCTSSPHPTSCSGAYPSPNGTSSSKTSTRACVAITPHYAPS